MFSIMTFRSNVTENSTFQAMYDDFKIYTGNNSNQNVILIDGLAYKIAGRSCEAFGELDKTKRTLN